MIEYTDESICYFIHLHNNHNKITCCNIEMKSHINEIDIFNKKIIYKNQLIQLMQIKSEIFAFKSEYIKNIYAIGNNSAYSCLAKYDEIPIRIKQILIKVEINGMLIEEFNVQIKEHNEQLNECLEYYEINKEMMDYFKTNGYNIFDNDFLEYVKSVFNNKVESKIEKSRRLRCGNKNLNDLPRKITYKYNGKGIECGAKQNIHDMYIFKNFESCCDKQNEMLKFHTYPLLFENEKEMIITINYYYYQQNRINIQLLKFNGDIYGEIFKYFTKPKQVFTMALVCKMFYAMAKNKVIPLLRGQNCQTCNLPIYERTLSVQCNTCNQLEHIKCFNIIFKSINILNDCILPISQYFTTKNLVRLGFVCKNIYNIVKTFVVKIIPERKGCQNCIYNVCVIGKSIKNKGFCGRCLNFKVYHEFTNRSWAHCYKCGAQYIVGKYSKDFKGKCQVCRK